MVPTGPSGDKESVVCPNTRIHACAIVFATASGNVLLPMCVADGEEFKDGEPDI